MKKGEDAIADLVFEEEVAAVVEVEVAMTAVTDGKGQDFVREVGEREEERVEEEEREGGGRGDGGAGVVKR